MNRFSPTAGTTYGSLVLTSADRLAPDISAEARTRSSSASGEVSVEEMPTRIAPRSRRWRVSARVSMPLMPTTPWSRSASSSDRVATASWTGPRAGSRTTYPATQILRGLRVLVVHAGVADVRGGHHHDLAVVRRVGQRLLVAAHAGREDRLAEGLAGGAVGVAAEGAAVLEDEHRW